LVDGHTEQRFIQQICPGRPVQRLGLNGNTVSASAIAKRAATQIRLWGGKYYPIVLVIDHEDRIVTPADFSGQISDSFISEGIKEDVRICVAMRMIENWIIADAETVGWMDPPSSVDGLHGANVLKKILGQYDKAGDGPDLLGACRPSKIALRSSSFESAKKLLSDISCHWLAR